MSITHLKKIETFLIVNDNIKPNKTKAKMEFVILDTPVEIVKQWDCSYVITTWTYNSNKLYSEYSGCYQGNHYCTIFDTELDARIEFNNAIQSNTFTQVTLIRIDPNSNENKETRIDEWNNCTYVKKSRLRKPDHIETCSVCNIQKNIDDIVCIQFKPIKVWKCCDCNYKEIMDEYNL